MKLLLLFLLIKEYAEEPLNEGSGRHAEGQREVHKNHRTAQVGRDLKNTNTIWPNLLWEGEPR